MKHLYSLSHLTFWQNKSFNNIIRYGHKVTKNVEINGISHLDRKTLCKIVVAFAHCQQIVIGRLLDIDLTGDFAISENWKINVEKLSLQTSLCQDIYSEQLHSFLGPSKIEKSSFVEDQIYSGATFLNSEANKNIEITLKRMRKRISCMSPM